MTTELIVVLAIGVAALILCGFNVYVCSNIFKTIEETEEMAAKTASENAELRLLIQANYEKILNQIMETDRRYSQVIEYIGDLSNDVDTCKLGIQEINDSFDDAIQDIPKFAEILKNSIIEGADEGFGSQFAKYGDVFGEQMGEALSRHFYLPQEPNQGGEEE